MNNLTKKLSTKLCPFMALIAYKSDSDSDFYIEQRKIESTGKMSAGSPLKEKTLRQMLEAISVNDDEYDPRISGTIPSNLLYCDTRIGNNTLVWYRPPEERSVCFTSNTGINDGKMRVPGLLYVAKGEHLALYAFKGRKPKRKLYLAPFMNVDSTHVCLGNAKLKKPENPTFSNLMTYWEGMFWQSEFSHILGANPIKGILASITKECIETGCEFPTHLLVPTNLTLNDLLK